MNIISFFMIILFLIGYFPIQSSNNNSLIMFILNSSLSINYYSKRRLSRYLNITTGDISSSTDRIHTFDASHNYNIMKDGSSLTKTQIKVIVTVVFIISFIMLIIAIFRFKNACRTQETTNLQTDIIRNRASQYSEPSSRRGSVGYYTQKYNRPTNIRFDDQLNISLPAKRLSIPACDHSSNSTAVVILSSSSLHPTDIPHHRHHVTSSCDTSNLSNQQILTDIKPVPDKSSPSISINQCDDQTPLLTSELAPTIKDSSNPSTRKYSLNAFLPLIRPSASHPLCSSLTSTIAAGNDFGNNHGVDLKSRRRGSLSSVLHRSSFTKQTHILPPTNTNQTPTPSVLPIDSDSSDRTSLLPNKRHRKKSSNITTSLSSYPKDFMHKIERFRFIDDSASSTTTVTSPVESVGHEDTRQACSHLITSAIEQFDDYVRTKYHDDDDEEVNSLIECLNAELLTNGSYSDLNILNRHSSTKPILRPQTFKPVNAGTSQTKTNLSACRSIPITIPHSITSLPISRQRNPVEINGHSRSMDFQSLFHRRDLISTINETSSSSTTTLASIRSATSLEFDDNTKPSGVLVDDDFLPMSSPIDEHFWNTTEKNYSRSNHNECFPNVGSSPDVEIRHFNLQTLNTLSETSCDEDDDDDDSTSSINQSEIFSTKILPDKDPSMDSTEQFDINSNSTLISLDPSLLEKLSSPILSDFFCETISSSHQQSETISEEDSANEASEGDDESADDGEIDLVQEFELSQLTNFNLSSINNDDVDLNPEDEFISDLSPTIINRSQPTSIMKITTPKTPEIIDDQQQTFKPKVRFNLDPQYEREREWNKVNKLLGNSVEWTDEFEV